MQDTRPPEDSHEEIYWLRGYEAGIYWLRGYEAGVETMRREEPVRMLADLYCRHADAALDKDEPTRKRLRDLIAEFERSFPDAAAEFKERYGKK